MTRLPLYQVDAFTGHLFGGNPAAIVPLQSWLPDSTLQAIATENNLAETAFTVPAGDAFSLRWFTPAREVDLCGHATLATAFVMRECLGRRDAQLAFETKSGRLTVREAGNGLLELNFPARPATPMALPPAISAALGDMPAEALADGTNWLLVFPDLAAVKALAPDFPALRRALSEAGDRGLIATGPGAGETDFVSRYFAPNWGIDEDPVTGSSHCTLAPYWALRLAKTRLVAEQISARGGKLWITLDGDRVRMAGQSVLYSEGHLYLR